MVICTLQVLYNKDNDEILGVQIIGLHAADLIQECANAMAAGTTVKQLAMMVSLSSDEHLACFIIFSVVCRRTHTRL